MAVSFCVRVSELEIMEEKSWGSEGRELGSKEELERMVDVEGREGWVDGKGEDREGVVKDVRPGVVMFIVLSMLDEARCAA